MIGAASLIASSLQREARYGHPGTAERLGSDRSPPAFEEAPATACAASLPLTGRAPSGARPQIWSMPGPSLRPRLTIYSAACERRSSPCAVSGASV